MLHKEVKEHLELFNNLCIIYSIPSMSFKIHFCLIAKFGFPTWACGRAMFVIVLHVLLWTEKLIITAPPQKKWFDGIWLQYRYF